MSKIYDANGSKMNVGQIVVEVLETANDEQKSALAKSLRNYEGIENSQMRVAHAILDSYKYIDGTTEKGMRLRKLLDNLMTKYQKSIAQIGADDQSQYNYLIRELSK